MANKFNDIAQVDPIHQVASPEKRVKDGEPRTIEVIREFPRNVVMIG